MTDFERIAFNAFKYIFTNLKHNGFHFHFALSIWRHIQQIQRLSTKYKLDPNFSSHIKIISALASLYHQTMSYSRLKNCWSPSHFFVKIKNFIFTHLLTISRTRGLDVEEEEMFENHHI